MLLDLAAEVELETSEIDRIQSELSELELELAVLAADGDARHGEVAAQVAQLDAALGDAYRDLHEKLTAARAGAPPRMEGPEFTSGPETDAGPLFEELDALVEQYRSV